MNFWIFFIERKKFQCIHMDTDSIYAAFSGSSLFEVVRPHLLQQFKDLVCTPSKVCRDDIDVTPSNGYWLPRLCCKKHNTWDQRTPGLMKLEFSGNEVIALSSKTYMVKSNQEGVKDKISAKGVNQAFLREPWQLYKNVLTTGKSEKVTNRGIKLNQENRLCTYQQEKTGFTCNYLKRELLSDGINTKPLNIVLSPWPNFNTVTFGGDFNPLAPLYKCKLTVNGTAFNSAEQLFQYVKALFYKEHKLAEKILRAGSPHESRLLGRKLKLSYKWFSVRDSFMLSVLKTKMAQVPSVLSFLQKHPNKLFVYTDLGERYWSCQLPKRQALQMCPTQYPGKNKLGNMWTSINK